MSQRAHRDEPILVQSGLTESHLVPVFAEDPLFMEYVACRVSRFYLEEHHPRYALPFLWDERSGIDDFYRELLAALAVRDDAGFWVAAATDTDLNRSSLVGIQRIAIEAGFVAAEEQVWPTVTLIHYVGQHGRSG